MIDSLSAKEGGRNCVASVPTLTELTLFLVKHLSRYLFRLCLTLLRVLINLTGKATLILEHGYITSLVIKHHDIKINYQR